MSTISASNYCEAAEMLLGHAAAMAIPYTPGGHSLMGMDCQGLCEYLLMQCGIPYKECNLAGSNAHYRACVWTGTPEECKQQFGRIPAGVWLFILEHDGGEPDKYKGDGIGNASHMGVYLGAGVAIHASASRGRVAESDFSERTVPNGGWNRVGLPRWVEYGLTTTQEPNETPTKHTAYVISENGNPVHLRADPSTYKPYLDKINVGMPVEVISTSIVGGIEWAKVYVAGQTGYMQSRFLSGSLLNQDVATPPSSGQVMVCLEQQLAEKLLNALQSGLARG